MRNPYPRSTIGDEQMTTGLGFAVATIGLAIAAVGVIGANVVFFRSLPKMLDRAAVRRAPIVAFEFVFWLLLWAGLGTLGIAILLLGLVIAGGLVQWAPLAPTALVVLMISLGWYSRWRIHQLRNG